MRKRYYLSIIIGSLAVLAAFTFVVKAFSYPQSLDSANTGPAGPNNQLFSNVLNDGVTDPAWFKVDSNLYLAKTAILYPAAIGKPLKPLCPLIIKQNA